MPTFFLDYEGGNDSNDGTTFANRWKTITSGATAARIAPGDTIRIMGSPAPTSLGINTTWTNNSPTITLASALTANISLCTAGWTASANVTTTTSSDRKEGTLSTSVAVGASFTTGLAAYEATGTLDLSTYNQVSFWIKQTVGTVGIATDYTLRLCSDAVGAVTVNTIAIPAMVALNTWIPFTVDTGGALGNAIASVAFYVETDQAAVTFLIDNIMAVKTAGNDALSLQSLIGKPNSTGAGGTDAETWYGIRSINTTTVTLDLGPNSSNATASRGYNGTSETVTGYKRETIKTDMTTAANTDVQAVQDSGTIGSLIAFEGGWDRTDMTTQTLETWFDGKNGLGDGIAVTGRSFTSYNKIYGVRYGIFLFFSGSSNNNTITSIFGNNNTTNGLGVQTSHNNTFTSVTCCNNTSVGLLITTAANNVFTTVIANNNGATAGINLSGAYQNKLLSVTANNNTTAAFAFSSASSNNFFGPTVTTSNNSTRSLTGDGWNYFRNATFNEATKYSSTNAFANAKIFSKDDGGTAGNFRIYMDGGDVITDSSTTHSSGISWKMSPTSANRSASYPLELSLARIAVNANTEVTVSAWARRDSLSLTAVLICKGGQLNGVANDVSATISAAINTWENLTIQFTPTEAGAIEIMGYAYGGTTLNCWWDDMTIYQA